jgi:hypothetical protein
MSKRGKSKGRQSSTEGKKQQQQTHEGLLKFPRTRHLFDTGGDAVTRDDILVPSSEHEQYWGAKTARKCVVQEKVDGANLGISIRKSDDKVMQLVHVKFDFTSL